MQRQETYKQKKFNEQQDLFCTVSSANVVDTDSSLSADDMASDTVFTIEKVLQHLQLIMAKKMVHASIFLLTVCLNKQWLRH